jgi:hypothetical protein
MEQVIGEYHARLEAERAVRVLEGRGVSIQDVVVADRKHPTWRKIRPPHGKHFPTWARYLVLMRGDPQEIERARALLPESALATPGRPALEASP